MDKYATTIDTFNKTAQNYQNKFMPMNLYNGTYDKFCDLVQKKDASILEIACGPGNITQYLLSKHPDYKILGIDLAEKMVELAKENIPTAEFQFMDCRNISAIHNKFDAIMCGFCLPFLTKEESEKLIVDSYKLLNNNGVFYISTMEGNYFDSGFETTSFSNGNQVFIHYHQADFLLQALKNAGFKNIDLIKQNYPEPNGSFTTDMFFLAQK